MKHHTRLEKRLRHPSYSLSMTPRQASPVPSSLLLVPTGTLDAANPQNITPQDSISPPLSPSQKPSGFIHLRSAAAYPTAAPTTPPLRKTSSTGTLIPLINPLQIFKRQNRKASLDAVLLHPSVQSLKAQLLSSAANEPPAAETETPYDSFDYHVAHKESGIQTSSTMLLPSSPSSEDEGYGTETQSQISLRKPHVGSLCSEDEGYSSDHRCETNLKHPTRIERRVSSPNVTTKHSISSSCALCESELKGTLETYAFPNTAPAVIASVRSLYPALDSNRNNRSLTNWIKSNTVRKPVNVAAEMSTPPTFCLTCFEELHALHICWTCGLAVHRAEERVGYGWAWWHWGCMSCLLCRAPVRPPAWIAASITLSDSPACKSCLRELRELVSIERRKLSLCRR